MEQAWFSVAGLILDIGGFSLIARDGGDNGNNGTLKR